MKKNVFLLLIVVFAFSGCTQKSSDLSSSDQPERMTTEASPSLAQSPAPSPAPMKSWREFKTSEGLFKFEVPTNWIVEEQKGIVSVCDERKAECLTISYSTEGKPAGYSGTAAGDITNSRNISFLGKSIAKSKLVLHGITTQVFYGGPPATVVISGKINFLIWLTWGGDTVSPQGIPAQTEEAADRILSSFRLQNTLFIVPTR